MRQKSGPEKQPAEDAIRDIRRATRRHFSAEEKIRIVLEGRGGEHSRALPPRGHRLSMYYGWSKEFLEAGRRRLAGDRARAATSDEVKDLRREAQVLKEVVADLTLDNRLLKKRMARPVCKGLIESAERSVCFSVSGLGGVPPGQDGDTRAPVLIKPSASSAAFLTRAGCFWLELRWDSRIGQILIQPVGFRGGQQECQSHIRKTCVTA